MAPGAVQRQTSGAGGPAAAQRSLRGRPGHPEEPAAGGQLQTVGGANSCDMSLLRLNCKALFSNHFVLFSTNNRSHKDSHE